MTRGYHEHFNLDEENSWRLEEQIDQAKLGNGCISGFLLPPLAVLMVISAVFFLMVNADFQVEALSLNASSSSEVLNFDLDVSNGQEVSPEFILESNSPLSPVFRPEVRFWGADISRWAAQFNLDPNLVATVMQIESCGDPRALSRSGAMGLFQVMPFHFVDSDQPYEPDTNAARGLAYLDRALETAGGEARLALAGYNGGIGVISRPESSWSEQTRRYVEYGSPIYTDASSSSTFSEALDKWYSKYGSSLCRQARNHIGLN